MAIVVEYQTVELDTIPPPSVELPRDSELVGYPKVETFTVMMTPHCL